MFNALPENSISIKIGEKNTSARYYVRSTLELKSILSNFIKSDKKGLKINDNFITL